MGRWAWILVTLVACGGDDDAAIDAGTDATDSSVDAYDGGIDGVSIRIVALNDFHGRLEAGPGDVGGAAYLAAHIAALEGEQPNTLVVSAGDLVGGSGFLSGAHRDEPTIAIMNAIGLDVAADGNHEHDRPVGELVRLIEGGCPEGDCADGTSWAGADFPFLSANLVDDEGAAIFDGYVIHEVDGVRIGFIGMTYATTSDSIVPEYAEGIAFLDEVETIDALVPEIQAQGVEAIVAVVHQGGRILGEPCLNPVGPIFGIAQRIDEAVDLVISGHTHSSFVCDVGGHFVTQAGSYGEQVAVIELEIDRATGEVVHRAATLRDITRDLSPDAAIDAMLDAYRSGLEDPVVGEITESLLRARNDAGQSALGDVIADAYLAANPAADVAFQNAGGIRDDLMFARSGDETAEGQVRLSELFQVTPFSNQLLTFELTGAELRALLEQMLADGFSDGRDLLPSQGFELEYDLSMSPRVRELRLGGSPIADDDVVRVTLNDFAVGVYDSLLPTIDEAVYLGTDLGHLRAYVEARSPIAPPATPRLIAPE